MVLMKLFLTGALHDPSLLICGYLNERDYFRKRYICLKLMIQAHLHSLFFKTFFIKHGLLKRFY